MTPGTRPLPRRRRLAPVPCCVRGNAVTSIFICYSTVKRGSRPNSLVGLPLTAYPYEARYSALIRRSFDEQRAHRCFFTDPPHRLGHQARDGEHADLGTVARFFAQRNGVGDDDLVD